MAAAIAATVGVPALAAPPALDTIAPDFALKGSDGRNVRLSEYRGEPVVLHFWASWCGPCRESVAALDALARSSGTPMLGVNLDGADRAAAVAESLHLTTPTLVDAQQSVARTYDVAKLPLTLLLDAEGHVRASWSGVPADLAELTPQLERLRQD
jgi:peroxiredoxin